MVMFSLGRVTYFKVQESISESFHVSRLYNIFLQAAALPKLTFAC